jgi:NMT1/THI5 like
MSQQRRRATSPIRGGLSSRRIRASAAAVLSLSAVLSLTACGVGGLDRSGAAASAAGNGDSGPLKGVCPDPIVVQTSWYPESTHGGLFELLGGNYTVDKAHKRVTGPLISHGKNTGVKLEIRAGGPALGNQPVSALMTTDKSITLAQQATEEQVLGWASGQPTVAVIAPFDVDPVVFIWDRKRHPEFNNLQDVGQTGTKVLTFRSANIDYLLGAGILRPSQVDYSYDGSPSRLLADRSIVVGGFSTNEPFIYKSLGVDVGYQYVSETGYPDYRNMLVVRRDAQPQLNGCLKKLVPVLQRGMIDFMVNPEPVLRLIVRIDNEYAGPYPYPIEQGRAGVKVIKSDGLVENPASMRGAAFGAIDPDRVKRMLGILRPIYGAQKKSVPGDATADTLATNEYLEAALKLPDT